MPKYIFELEVSYMKSYTVEADSEEEAKQKIIDGLVPYDYESEEVDSFLECVGEEK